MKLRKNKKGFTIVELVIVVAIIGVLSAVLIPTFMNLVSKANEASDQSLVKNLNTVLSVAEADAEKRYEKPQNPTDMFNILKAEGYLGETLIKNQKSEKKIFYNLDTNRFLLEENIDSTVAKDTYWEFVKKNADFDNTNGYSKYLFTETSGAFTVYSGIDTGENDDITEIKYFEAAISKTAIIRTDSFDTSVEINAPHDDVKHYGKAGSVNIIAVKGSSYHENGTVAFLEIANGRVALEKTSSVDHIHLTKSVVNEVEKFNNITIAKADNVDMPQFSRDPIDIPTEGRLVVALQEGTANPTAQKEYVWLTAVGIYEQVTVSNSDSSAGNNYAADSENDDQKAAAAQIANNITFSAGGVNYKVVAEKSGNSWTYEVTPIEGEALQTYTATYDEEDGIVVKDGTNAEVVTTTQNGLTEGEKEATKNSTVSKVKEITSFTGTIVDIGVQYYASLSKGIYIKKGYQYDFDVDEMLYNYEDAEGKTFGDLDFNEYAYAEDLTVTWESSDHSVATVIVTEVYKSEDGFWGEEEIYTPEEYAILAQDEDFDEDDYSHVFTITIDSHDAGVSEITLTFTDVNNESISVPLAAIVYEDQVMLGEDERIISGYYDEVGVYHSSIQLAVEQAQEGEVIKLFKNIGSKVIYIQSGDWDKTSDSNTSAHFTATMTNVKDITIDLNGYSITAGSISIMNTNVTIIDSSLEQTGKINSLIDVDFDGNTADFYYQYGWHYETLTNDNPATLTLKGGTIRVINIAEYAKVVVDGARVVNNGGEISEFSISSYADKYEYRFAIGYGSSATPTGATVVVKSGIVSGLDCDIKYETNSSGYSVDVTGGAFHYKPVSIIDSEQYFAEQNDEGLWLVIAK